MCVCRRHSYWVVSVTPLLQSHAVAQHQQVKGGGTSIPVGLLCSSPVHTGCLCARQAVFLPLSICAYATTALQFYTEPEHGTWGWPFLT